MKKRITAALLTAILIISCFPSGVMTTISRADDAKKENILTKISEDAVLKYNTATGRYEGTAKLLVTGIQDEQCIVLNVNDIRDTNGCTLDVTFVDDEDKEEMTYKNGDIITLLYAASNYAYNVAYNIQLEVKGTVKKDYRALEIPELSAAEWEYEISGDTVILGKYIGTNKDIVLYPQYSIAGTVYNTHMKITQYKTEYYNDGDYDTDDWENSEVYDADGPFVNNTKIKSVKFLDGVKIGSDTSKDIVVCADTLNDYSSVDGSIKSIADSTVYNALDEPGALDMYGNSTVETVEGQNMKAMFAGCTSLEKVENIPDDVVKMENTFRVVSVFDVSQTEGKELPSMAHDLEGNINDYLLYIQALKEASGVPIHFEEIDGDAHGYYNRATDSIAVKSGMSESQTVKTMIHEIAHSILHNDNAADAGEKNRRTKEVEAESVAYTVCKHFGIDTSDYSFGYIAGWSADKELSELKASLETIRKTSSGLITDIEDKLEKLRLDKDMNVSEQASENVTESRPLVTESRPNVTESRPNVTESVTSELQHSRDMMMAALGSTGDLLSSYENKASGTVTESVTVVAEEKAGYESRMPVRKAIENREHTYHSAYADIGMVLDNYTTDELIEYLKNNEPGGESSLRNYVESQIIGAQINRERYQSENNIVTESVTKDMPDEPDIKQVAGMRI